MKPNIKNYRGKIKTHQYIPNVKIDLMVIK